MSHYATLVIGENPGELLAPFDENLEVDPYRKYVEDDKPGDYWWVRSMRRGAEHYREGTGIKPYNPKMFASFRTSESRQIAEEQRAEFAEDAHWAERLGDDPTWETVVSLYSEKYPDDGDGERLHYDAEQCRAYTMSTYNPKSKHDWYELGGRWTGYYKLRDDGDPGRARGIVGRPGLMTPTAKPGWVDQARKRDIDFEGMRAQAEAEAVSNHAQATAALADLPKPARWVNVREVFPDDIDAARKVYHEQPALRALRDAGIHIDEPVEWFCLEEDDPAAAFIAREVATADIPFAILTADGWAEKGHMRWWGIVTDENADWYATARQIIDDAPDSALFSLYDLHI